MPEEISEPVARPPWPRKRLTFHPEFHEIKATLRKHQVRSVCEDARCPNISECFGRREATFIILGDTCTRRCGFCAIPTGKPLPPDGDEPMRLAQAAREIGLRHIVITAVARDDLKDGGAAHFAACIDAVRTVSPETTVEVLTSDFKGEDDCLDVIAQTDLQVFNHNVETVPRLHRKVRPQAKYERSLDVLYRFKQRRPEVITKSGIMLGLGETDDEVHTVLRDMLRHEIDVVTIGQYMQPTKEKLPVVEYSTIERFEQFREFGNVLGFTLVSSGPYVRSSFGAADAARLVGVGSARNGATRVNNDSPGVLRTIIFEAH